MSTKRIPHGVGEAAVLLIAALSAACADREAPLTPEVQFSTGGPGAALVYCPGPPPDRPVTATIGPAGGTISVGPHSMSVPAGAVALPIRFEMREVESPYLEVQITANDLASFDFLVPVRVTLNYARCRPAIPLGSEVTVWKVDPDTKERLRYMGGQDDRGAASITFSTGSLSNYAIAN